MAALVIGVHCIKACCHGSAHTHGLHNFGISTASFQVRMACGGEPNRGLGRRACHSLRRYGEDNQNEGAERRRDTNQGMKEKTNSHIKRHPRQIEQSTWASATKKATDLIEVAD